MSNGRNVVKAKVTVARVAHGDGSHGVPSYPAGVTKCHVFSLWPCAHLTPPQYVTGGRACSATPTARSPRPGCSRGLHPRWECPRARLIRDDAPMAPVPKHLLQEPPLTCGAYLGKADPHGPALNAKWSTSQPLTPPPVRLESTVCPPVTAAGCSCKRVYTIAAPLSRG